MTRKNVIVGAGFSGVLLATKLFDATIISRDVGGLISSYSCNGFKFDIGVHVYTSKCKELNELMELAGGTFHPERKAFYMPGSITDGLVSYPVQSHAEDLGLKIDHDVSIEDPSNFYEMSLSMFGSNFVENFLRPFNERVWSTPMELMDIDWMKGRVQAPSEKKENWGSNSSFWYAPGDDIMAALIGKSQDTNVELVKGYVYHIDVDCKVVYYSRDRQNYEISYENLFVTTPYFLPFHRRNRILAVGIGLNRKLDADFHWIYNQINSKIHRITLLSRFHPSNAPEGCDSLLFELPYYPHGIEQTEMLRLQDRLEHLGQREGGYQFIKGTGFSEVIERDDIAALWMMNSPGYPVPTLGSRSEVAAIKEILFPKNVYLLGRFGSHLYANLEHLFGEVEATINATTKPTAYFDSTNYYKNL